MPEPQIDPTWWEQAELKAALAEHDIQAVFAQLQRSGWSQTAIGAKIGLSQGEVSEIRRGIRRVGSYAVLSRIAASFDIPPGHMGLAWTTRPDVNAEQDNVPLNRRELLGINAALAVGAPVPDLERWLPTPTQSQVVLPSRIGKNDVADLKTLTSGLWELDQQRGGGSALDAAMGALGAATRLQRSDASDRTALELHTARADLHSLVGWSLHDLGRHEQAMRHFTAALAIGADIGDRSMVAAALYRLGRVSLHIQQPGEALRAFQLGTMAAQDAGSYPDLARLHVSSAWAYALMNEPDRMLDSYARGEHELGRIDPENSTPWAEAFIRSGDWDGIKAMSYIILSRTPGPKSSKFAEEAARIAQRIVTKPAEGRPQRSRIFDEIILAAGQLQVGDIEHGLTAAHTAIDHVEEIQSVRAIDRLDDIDRAAKLVSTGEINELRVRIARLHST